MLAQAGDAGGPGRDLYLRDRAVSERSRCRLPSFGCRACCRWSITSALWVRSSWRRFSGSGSGADSRSRSPRSAIAPPARSTASMRGRALMALASMLDARARDCSDRVGAERSRNSAAGQFRWSVSDGGWSVPGRDSAPNSCSIFKVLVSLGSLVSFRNIGPRRVAQFARAPVAAHCAIERRRGHISTSQPTASRKSRILPTPMFYFLPKLTKLTTARESAAFRGLPPGQFRRAGQFRRPVGRFRRPARSLEGAADRAASPRSCGAPCSCPGPIARRQQSLLGQPLPERPLLDRNARALIARQLLRRGEGGLRLQQEVVVADPAEPLAVRPPDLPRVVVPSRRR